MLYAVHAESFDATPKIPYTPRIYGFKVHATAWDEMKRRRQLEIANERTVRAAHRSGGGGGGGGGGAAGGVVHA